MAYMGRRAKVVVVIAAGVLWGLSEIFIGDIFYRYHIPMRGASLAALGMMILVIARLLHDRFGSSIVIALIAGGLRCLVPRLYICHFVAIALEGFAFDAMWILLRAGQSKSTRRAWLATVLGVYSGFFAFALASIYLFKFARWVAGGITGSALWTLRSGSLAAVLLLGLVPLAMAVAGRLERARVAHRPEVKI